jgi:beta-lactamase regulating signal transducer with metallopeptidase domain
MTAVARGLEAALVHGVWQDAAVASLLWATLLLLKNSSANARYVACCAGLALMALLPLGTFVAVNGVYTAEPLPAGVGVTQSPTAQSAPDLAEYTQTRSRIWTNLSLSERSRLAFLQPWILPLWIVGVLIFSLRLVYAATHSIGLTTRAAPADDETLTRVACLAASLGVHRQIQVLFTDNTLGPGTIGWLKPIILLPPAAVLGLTPLQVEALLAHEIAHVRRWDYLVNLFQLLVETLFFYHPAVWWASTRIRIERELCCDDAAVRSCGDAIEYANALTAVARFPFARHGMVAASGGTLVSRIERLLRPPALANAATPRSAIIFVVVAALAVSAVTAPLVGAQSTQRRPLTASELGTLSLAVYDPFGEPAADVLLVFEQAAFQAGALFGDGRTDGSGTYRVRLPPGKYVFTALEDFFPPTEVTITAGKATHHDIRMKVDAVTGAFTVCVDCPSGAAPAIPPSVAEDLRRDREAAAAQVIAPAEPAGGWEHYTPAVPPLLAQRHDILGGIVIVEGRIAPNGRLLDVTIVSAAQADLADAVRAAIQSERWQPARVRGVPIETPLRLTINYVRQGSQK